MRMPGDKQLRRVGINFRLYRRVIAAGVTADMSYPGINLLAPETQVQRKILSDRGAVYITINAFQRFKGSQLFGHAFAKITGMLYLIARGEVFKYGIIEVAVGI